MTYILNPVMEHGWMCPNCKTAHSPSVMTCPISQTVRLTGTDTGTPYPLDQRGYVPDAQIPNQIPPLPQGGTAQSPASPSCTHVWVDAVFGEYCQYCRRVRRSISQEDA
jgi:hypothetical protein